MNSVVCFPDLPCWHWGSYFPCYQKCCLWWLPADSLPRHFPHPNKSPCPKWPSPLEQTTSSYWWIWGYRAYAPFPKLRMFFKGHFSLRIWGTYERPYQGLVQLLLKSAFLTHLEVFFSRVLPKKSTYRQMSALEFISQETIFATCAKPQPG